MFENGVNPGLHFPGVGRVEGVVQAIQLLERARASRRSHDRAHPMARLVIPCEQGAGVAESPGDHLKDGPLHIVRNLLLESGDRDPRLANHLSTGWGELAVQQLENGALSRAVAAEQTDPLAALDRKARTIENRGTAEGQRDILHSEKSHSAKYGRWRSSGGC